MVEETLNKYKEDLLNCIKDLKNIKTWYKQIPNLLTLSRPIGIIPANILFFTGHPIPAVILTTILLLTDLFDGKLARKWNVQSKFGADLDAVGDKIMFMGMALPIALNNPIMLLTIILEGIISYINVLGRIKGLDTKTVYSGKLKTWLLSLSLLTGYITYFLGIPDTTLKILISITFISQGITIKDYIQEYKRMKKLKEYENHIKTVEEEIKKEETQNKEKTNLLEELIKEKEFLLSTTEHNKESQNKKRTKTIFKENKNNYQS